MEVKVESSYCIVLCVSAGTPIIVSQAGGKGGQQNIQVVRTVLSQQGALKPGQATILISQPALQQAGAGGNILSSAQVLQAAGGASASKTTGRGSPKGKAQPVYARIITPPPGMKLTTVGPNQVGASGNVNMLQTVGKLLAGLPTTVTTSPGGSGGAVQQTVTTVTIPTSAAAQPVVVAAPQSQSTGQSILKPQLPDGTGEGGS